MNTIWETVTWDVARAGGFTAYVLLTLAVVVGLALSTQIQSPSRWPRLLNSELHNFLTLLSTIFLGVHVLTVWVDPFTHFGWNEILIPLTSHYRAVWMALGIVALYLGIAIGISTWLRPHIGYRWWRRLHVLTLGIFALATIHGLGTGSDTQTWWALGIYLGSSILVGSLLCRRVLSAIGKRKHAFTPGRPGRGHYLSPRQGPSPLLYTISPTNSRRGAQGEGKPRPYYTRPRQPMRVEEGRSL